SVGSKGDSYDNALAETINGLYKAELIHRRGPWAAAGSVDTGLSFLSLLELYGTEIRCSPQA
ncbi:hypothetical protein, partial [Hydrogenophaga electricum]|uniref:hypothetical protein n=1 Tax=Hydrogenophaga electricum TaxID=1230953 RepID=UPI0024E1178C